MSDNTINHLLEFEHIADSLYEELTTQFPQTQITYEECSEYVFLTFQDLANTRLVNPQALGKGSRRIEFINPILSRIMLQDVYGDGWSSLIKGILSHIDVKVEAELTRCIPVLTWSYIFVARLGSTVRIEISGDRRLDEWTILIRKNVLPLDEIMSSFIDSLKEKARDIQVDGVLIDIDMYASAIEESLRNIITSATVTD